MGMVEDTVVKAKEAFDVAAKKTNEVIALQKLKVSASTVNSQMTKAYGVLGRLTYDMHVTGKDNTTAIDALLEELDGYQKELEALEGKIALAKGLKICATCGQKNSAASDFCGKCGSKLGAAEKQSPADEQGSE